MIAGHIVKVAVLFTAGVGLASLCPIDPWSMSVVGQMGAVLSFIPFLLSKRFPGMRHTRLQDVFILISIFFIGVVYYGTAILKEMSALSHDGPMIALTRECLGRLQGIIDGIGWGRRQTAGLLRALLSGDRGALDPAVAAAFRAAGASHILALSGLHLGIIYGIVTKCLSILGRSPAAFAIRSCITVLLCAFYTLMTGASPSLVRAFLFILINETLRFFPDRSRHPLSVLSVALMIQLVANPLVIKSLGFQLSYLSMTGIFVIFPRLQAWLPSPASDEKISFISRQIDKLTQLIWTSAAISISCQIMTAPLVWLRFHTFPQYFLLTNLLALPLTSLLMPASILSLILSAVGCCPHILVSITELLASALIRTLEIIAS